MYSHRLSWSTAPNNIHDLVRRKRRAGIRLLDLTQSNPTRVLPDYPHAAISRAYGAVSDFTYQPDPAGTWEAREAVSGYYGQRDFAVPPDRLVLTASTSEAYALLFKLLCDAGDEVLVPVPSYPLFEYLAALEGVRVVPYRLCYDGSWHIDFTHLRDQISPRAKAIVIVTPNNPTGSVLKTFEARELLRIGEERHLPIISDEVFMDYPLRKLPHAAPTLAAQSSVLTFALNGLSKAAGMPQMKLGWVVLGGPADEIKCARENLELLLDTYLSVGTPAQNALPDLLKIGAGIRAQIVRQVKQNLATLGKALDGSPAHCLETEAGWSAIVRLPSVRTEDNWTARLVEEGNTIVQPGYFFDMEQEAYIVVSLITPADEFEEGASKMRSLVENE
ncbi:MAG TPA: pyridoxal phosphate-dependent aminotransferase [Bryobacteraceae bacterium]|nr:pyridoxal phosphate-dependent aminotransferase [Bryobacteraceae bacterium]